MARRNPSNIIPLTRRCRRSAHEDVALRTVTWLLINRTRLGLAWRATEQDFETASAFGVNIDRGVASNFFLSSAVVGAAGVLVGFYYNSVYPTMGSVPA